jgi:hypothetical protein
MPSNKSNKKWFWTAIGTICLTIVSESIAEKAKDIPFLNYIFFFFRWLYRIASRFLNIEVKMCVIILSLLIVYTVWTFFRKLAIENGALPMFYEYTSDRFHEWTWKWSWEKGSDGWRMKDLAPYCSKCDVELGRNNIAGIARCPSCHIEYGYFGTTQPFETESDAEKLIRAKANKMKLK